MREIMGYFTATTLLAIAVVLMITLCARAGLAAPVAAESLQSRRLFGTVVTLSGSSCGGTNGFRDMDTCKYILNATLVERCPLPAYRKLLQDCMCNCTRAVPALAHPECAVGYDKEAVVGRNATASTFAHAQRVAAQELIDSFPAKRLKQADWGRACRDLFHRYNTAADPRWSVCGSRLAIFEKKGSLDQDPSIIHTSFINCNPDAKTGVSPFEDRAALIKLCSLPCFLDPAQTCCFVPKDLQPLFSESSTKPHAAQCCRAKGCCSDQVSLSGQAAVRVRKNKGGLDIVNCLARPDRHSRGSTACSNGNTCGRCLLASHTCPANMSTSYAPKCDHPDVREGDFCEGDGECGTRQDLDNCGRYDVYKRVAIPARVSNANDDLLKTHLAQCTAQDSPAPPSTPSPSAKAPTAKAPTAKAVTSCPAGSFACGDACPEDPWAADTHTAVERSFAMCTALSGYYNTGSAVLPCPPGTMSSTTSSITWSGITSSTAWSGATQASQCTEILPIPSATCQVARWPGPPGKANELVKLRAQSRLDMSTSNTAQLNPALDFLQFRPTAPALHLHHATTRANLLSSADFNLACSAMLLQYSASGSAEGSICSKDFALFGKSSPTSEPIKRVNFLGTATLQCRGNRDLYVLGKLCLATCMHDDTPDHPGCCWVPPDIAHLFGCCNKYGCCPGKSACVLPKICKQCMAAASKPKAWCESKGIDCGCTPSTTRRRGQGGKATPAVQVQVQAGGGAVQVKAGKASVRILATILDCLVQLDLQDPRYAACLSNILGPPHAVSHTTHHPTGHMSGSGTGTGSGGKDGHQV